MAQPLAKQIETALLTEHLKFTPLTLLDDIINTVNLLMNRAVDAAEQGLLDAPISALGYQSTPLESEEDLETRARREIEEGIVKLETLLESNVDKNFDKLEIYVLRNILCVEGELVPWVRLGHYEGLDFSKTKFEGGNGEGKAPPTQEGIQVLRKSLRESRRLQSAMNAQIAENSRLIAQLKGLTASAGSTSMDVNSGNDATPTSNGALSFLAADESAQKLGVRSTTQNQQPSTAKIETTEENAMDTTGTTSTAQQPPTGPLETNTLFTVSQIPALKALVADLRSKAMRQPADSKIPTNNLPQRRDKDFERRLYIEAQSRKAVQRIQGVPTLNATAGAAARDVLTGRRVGTEEVVTLEGITERLQAGRNDGAGGDDMDES